MTGDASNRFDGEKESNSKDVILDNAEPRLANVENLFTGFDRRIMERSCLDAVDRMQIQVLICGMSRR